MSDVQIQFSSKVREVCLRFFIPQKTLPDGKNNPNDHPALRAEAVSATECMVSLARVFKALETHHPSYITPIIVDLSFGLAENQFWKQHSSVLIPVFKSSLHACINAKLLSIQAQKTENEQTRQLRQETQWHSLFVIALDCLYGVTKSMEVSNLLLSDIEKL